MMRFPASSSWFAEAALVSSAEAMAQGVRWSHAWIAFRVDGQLRSGDARERGSPRVCPERPARACRTAGGPDDPSRLHTRARPDRRERRLRGRGMRRLRRGDGGSGRRAQRISGREQLPDVPADGRRAGDPYGRIARSRWRAVRRPARDGRGRRFPVRLLHAGLRRESVRRTVSSRSSGAVRHDGARGQFVPLHGLSSRFATQPFLSARRRKENFCRGSSARLPESTRSSFRDFPAPPMSMIASPFSNRIPTPESWRVPPILASNRISLPGGGRSSSASKRSMSCAISRARPRAWSSARRFH